MPACARCGKQFSGFPFGSEAPTECRECRRTRRQIGAVELNSQAAAKPTDRALAQSAGRPVVDATPYRDQCTGLLGDGAFRRVID